MSPSPPIVVRARGLDTVEDAQAPWVDGIKDDTQKASHLEFMPIGPRVSQESEDMSGSEIHTRVESFARSHQHKDGASLGHSDAFDTLELASGFQFGAPIPLAPGQFTRRNIVTTRYDEPPTSKRISQLDAGVGNHQASFHAGVQPGDPRQGSTLDHVDQVTPVASPPLSARPSQHETYYQGTHHEDQDAHLGAQHVATKSVLQRRPFPDMTAPLSKSAGPDTQPPTPNHCPSKGLTRSPQDNSAPVYPARQPLGLDPGETQGGADYRDTETPGSRERQLEESPHVLEQRSQKRVGSDDPTCISDLQFTVSRGNTSVTGRDSSQSDPSRQSSQGRELSRSQSRSSPVSNTSKLRSMPTRHGKSKLEMVKQFGSHFAHSWNSYVQDVTKAEDELETEFLYRLDKLKRKNEGQARQINLHVKQLNAQALVIAGLEQDKQDLMDRVARTETKLREGSERLQKLDEKCRLYKDRLNAAVGEHQQLYSRSKKLCKDTIDQMRAEEQLQRSSNDLARQKAESLREHMLEKVRLVVAQSKAETRHMTDRIQALSQEIGDRESQIQRERERSERLLKQLDEQREAHKSFQLLQVKTESILDKMDEHHTLHAQGVKVAHDSSRTKLDAVIEHLESLSKLIIPHSDALSKLSNHQQEGISKVVAGLEAIINSQANGRESVERLSTDLKSHVDEMWQKLETREDALTQQLSEKRGENALVTRVMEEREVEFQALEAQLEEANEGSRVQEDRIRQLTARVTELETAPPVDSEEMLRLKSLEDENSNIKCELAVKGALIADLQSKLRDKDKEGMAEAKKFNDDISKLSQLMHDQQLAGRAATGQAVENARHRLRLEMEGMHQETRNSLRLAEKQRLNLQVQLQDTMAKLATTDQRLCHDSARMISLQESLAAAESRINQLTEEAQTRAEAVNPQQKAAELAVDEMGKGLLGNLGRWTQARGINGAITHDLEKLFSHCIGTADVGRKLHDFLENALADRVPQPNGPPVRPHTGSGSPNTSAPSNERLAQEQDAENHLPISLSIGSEMDRNQNAKGSVSEASGSIAAREEDMPSSNAPSDQPMSRPGEEGLISQEPERRVVVQSPNIAQVMPVSLSVEQEKARRREVTQLKSIIKTRQESDGDIIQDSSQEKGSAGGVIPDIGSFLRGPYNRPVAGNVPREDRKSSQPEGPRPTSTPRLLRAPKRKVSTGGPRATKKYRRGPGDLGMAAEPLTLPPLKGPDVQSGLTPDDEYRPSDETGREVSVKDALPGQNSQRGPPRVTRSTLARGNTPRQQNSSNYQGGLGSASTPQPQQRGKGASGQRARGGNKSTSNSSFQTNASSSQVASGPGTDTPSSLITDGSSGIAPSLPSADPNSLGGGS